MEKIVKVTLRMDVVGLAVIAGVYKEIIGDDFYRSPSTKFAVASKKSWEFLV